MTIQVHVPPNTPAGDTVWIWGGLLFAANWHVQMSRVAGTSDTWQGTISAPAGTTVRYFYYRNNNVNQQEAYVPFGVAPQHHRELVMTAGATVVETIAQWVDTPQVNNSTGTLAGTVTDQAGNPLMGIWVSAGPHQRMTFSDGSFLIEGVPAGPNPITFRSDDSAYGPITMTTTIPAGGTTTKNVALTSAVMSTVTFSVTVPDNTPAGAFPRLFGDTYRLGWVPQLSSSFLVDTTRIVDMTPAAGNLWTYTVQLGNGTCVNYLYTLGDSGRNNERDNNGNAVTRSLCVNGTTTMNDAVTAWKSPRQVPISLTVNSPTGADDTLYVIIDDGMVGPYEPIQMWPTGPGTASYTLYADPFTTLNYHYIRNGDPYIGLEIVGTDRNPPANRTIATGASGAASDDTITVWRHQMRETALPTVATGIPPRIPVRPGFQTGVELEDYWHSMWLPLLAPTLARIKSDNAQWVQIAPVWSFLDVVNPTIEPVNISFPTNDLVTHIRAAKAAGLNVALTVEPFPNEFDGPNSTAWYDQFFNQIQLMALYHAKIAQQEGVGVLILGSLYFGVDDRGGPTSTYINAKWKRIIAAIRASGYTGKITSQVIVPLLEYDWYGDLDYLGDTWWWPVATTNSDTVQNMYDSARNRLTSYYLPIKNRFNKPLVFTSVAYYSADTSAMQTYNVDSPQINQNLPADPAVASAYNQQAQAYQAVLLALAGTPWVQGSYSFGYEYFNLDSKGYSIRGKTAENILSHIYRNINRLTITPSDFDGDGKTDIAVYRPSNGTWYILTSSSGFTSGAGYAWGASTDVPVPGDYDGDGKTDVAVYRPSSGHWFILQSSTNYTTSATYQWGTGGDVAVPGDYDGDGKTDLAIYRPSSGTWYILTSSSGFTSGAGYAWGVSTDLPMPGDYDGDGRTDVAVYRPSSGHWFILQSSTNYTTSITYQWGTSGDVAVPSDYDGDGKTDLAIYRPSNGTWYILTSSTSFTSGFGYVWGVSTDVPVPGDYDGDGKTDIAVYRPSTGNWFFLKSSTNYTTWGTYQWGTTGDVPILKRP